MDVKGSLSVMEHQFRPYLLSSRNRQSSCFTGDRACSVWRTNAIPPSGSILSSRNVVFECDVSAKTEEGKSARICAKCDGICICPDARVCILSFLWVFQTQLNSTKGLRVILHTTRRSYTACLSNSTQQMEKHMFTTLQGIQ